MGWDELFNFNTGFSFKDYEIPKKSTTTLKVKKPVKKN